MESENELNDPQTCMRCSGCGRIADTETGEPWSQWEEIPFPSDLAVRAGIVKPIPCPDCNGKGQTP